MCSVDYEMSLSRANIHLKALMQGSILYQHLLLYRKAAQPLLSWELVTSGNNKTNHRVYVLLSLHLPPMQKSPFPALCDSSSSGD